MAAPSDKNGLCPLPFLQQDLFPETGGFLPGRYCAPVPGLPSDVSCCLPCPLADWKFPRHFRASANVANWLAVAFFSLNGLILLSYAVLPVKVTHRHYLNACMMLGIMLMALAFIVPLGVQPEECYNDITPHGMKSDMTCAFSGALIISGGWAVVVWSFCRTLSLHLQICWDVVPGKKFFYTTLSVGWIFPFAMLAVAIAVTGTSYRFGNICHINHDHGLQDFWGPLMGLAALSLILHIGTLGYCIHIYIKSVMDNSPTTEGSSSFPAYSGSVRTASARQAYRRVKRVIQLQWRGIAVVLTVLGNVIFFTIIFLYLDESARQTPENMAKYQDWLVCLIASRGDRFECADKAETTGGPSEATTIAVLVMLSMSGLWTVIFFGHLSIIRGWFDFVRDKVTPRNEFVSMDAQRPGAQSRAYEMYGSKGVKSPEPLLADSPSDMSSSTFYHHSSPKEEEATYYRSEARYTSPVQSFSSPRPPSATRQHSFNRGWDPSSTFARGDPRNEPYRSHNYTHSRLS